MDLVFFINLNNFAYFSAMDSGVNIQIALQLDMAIDDMSNRHSCQE